MANLLNEETAQLYALCGRGPRSSLRVLRHGLAVAEMAVSELPGNPTAVWTIRRSATDELDAYIVVSFTNATLVCLSSTHTDLGKQAWRPAYCVDQSLAVSRAPAGSAHQRRTSKALTLDGAQHVSFSCAWVML